MDILRSDKLVVLSALVYGHSQPWPPHLLSVLRLKDEECQCVG